MAENLYEEYGRLMIQAEIVNNKINEVKNKIAQALRTPPMSSVVKEDDKQTTEDKPKE